MQLYLFSGLRLVTGLFHGCCCVSFQLRSLLWTSDQMWPQSELMEVISVGWLSEVDEGEIKLFPRIGENCCAEASERAGAGRARVCICCGHLGSQTTERSFGRKSGEFKRGLAVTGTAPTLSHHVVLFFWLSLMLSRFYFYYIPQKKT